jgi:hypothetical protein
VNIVVIWDGVEHFNPISFADTLLIPFKNWMEPLSVLLIGYTGLELPSRHIPPLLPACSEDHLLLVTLETTFSKIHQERILLSLPFLDFLNLSVANVL